VQGSSKMRWQRFSSTQLTHKRVNNEPNEGNRAGDFDRDDF
jgi:hypothetical protein